MSILTALSIIIGFLNLSILVLSGRIKSLKNRVKRLEKHTSLDIVMYMEEKQRDKERL